MLSKPAVTVAVRLVSPFRAEFIESRRMGLLRESQFIGFCLTQRAQDRGQSAQACAHLSRLASDLEAAAHPALDALTRKVTTGTLERVRRIKTRLVRLKTRVETVRRCLPHPMCCLYNTPDVPAHIPVH